MADAIAVLNAGSSSLKFSLYAETPQDLVLVARDGRELPIQADVQGTALALGRGQHLKLRGPEPLRLELVGDGA